MRIIAGEHRGRRLEAPSGRTTRPMLDRVREALFSTLGERVLGARVLDLFAGSGSLGLEALSRGAERARLVERDRDALRALQKNVATLQLADRAEIVRGDALDPRTWSAGETLADLCFYDPPYPLLESSRDRPRVLGALPRLFGEALSDDAVLVFHAPRGGVRAAELDPALAASTRDYGTSALWYLSRTVEDMRGEDD
jgi:16S rRNA (guanine966-N2)-methyltransferase